MSAQGLAKGLKGQEVGQEQLSLERAGIWGDMGIGQSQAVPGFLTSLQNSDEDKPRIPRGLQYHSRGLGITDLKKRNPESP